MIFLAKPSEESFRILLIASEILIPLIVFVGMYLIFKPVFGPKDDEDQEEGGERSSESEISAEESADQS